MAQRKRKKPTASEVRKSRENLRDARVADRVAKARGEGDEECHGRSLDEAN